MDCTANIMAMLSSLMDGMADLTESLLADGRESEAEGVSMAMDMVSERMEEIS